MLPFDAVNGINLAERKNVEAKNVDVKNVERKNVERILIEKKCRSYENVEKVDLDILDQRDRTFYFIQEKDT